MSAEQAWFEGWFNTKYYHMLYKDRDEEEAQFFVNNLLGYLSPPKNSILLDLACGKGRHSIFLAKKGFSVTGVDLSAESILEAQKSEHANLSFFQHDMRDFFRTNYFDYIFNLFTSFGYFETRKEHLTTLQNVRLGLKPKGILVLDFFNTEVVVKNLVPEETKAVGDIKFHITREHTGGKIIKSIEFEDNGISNRYREIVQAFTLEDFHTMFSHAGLKLIATFGDYSLNKFNPANSPRLILVGQKA